MSNSTCIFANMSVWNSRQCFAMMSGKATRFRTENVIIFVFWNLLCEVYETETRGAHIPSCIGWAGVQFLNNKYWNCNEFWTFTAGIQLGNFINY